MNYEEMKQQLAEVYSAAQQLQIQPTRQNVEIIGLILKNLDAVYGALCAEQQKAAATTEEKQEGE